MHSTSIGIIAEKKFALQCLERGISVLTPLIDENGFDYVIQRGSTYDKIQVKSTLSHDKRNPNSYRFSIKRGASSYKYRKGDYDLLVCYIFELDIFYIIPFSFIASRTIRINPTSIKCKFLKYKEAWNLIT
jgi:hypothetical protein